MKGPLVQKNLFEQLIKLCESKICFTADIAKMYRMVLVAQEDHRMQRIFWRRNPSDPIKEYDLNTITYSTTPASFLATMCLRVVASEIENINSEAARVIRENFYMDDLICRQSSIQEAVAINVTVYEALAARGFVLRKYSSNSDDFTNTIPAEARAENTSSVSTLGLLWQSQSDTLSVKMEVEQLPVKIVPTKRIILSAIAGVFDPLGTRDSFTSNCSQEITRSISVR